MESVLYAQQDSFGRKPWDKFAADAGVRDSAAFSACVRSDGAIPRIDRGIAAAAALQLTSTPTIIVNGWKFMGGPPDSVLSKAIDRLLAGKVPDGARRSMFAWFGAH